MLGQLKNKKLFFFTLASLGIVYGDIGTSPLYAINEIFFGHGRVGLTRLDVLGAISLVFWALTLVIAIKYIIFVLRADNEGKGGVFALYGLLDKKNYKGKWISIALLSVAAGLLFGEGIITPAISVISSTEGLANINTNLVPYIIPITLAILTGLFLIQKKGTAKVGTLFAPAIIIWFGSIAVFGALAIIKTPQILLSLNPYYGITFLLTHSFFSILLALGAVVLVITGGEALYADIAHFGALPIRLSWFSVVYPALVLNYLGQGAYILGKGPIYNHNVFFSMVPSVLLLPMIFVATVATIIASQALISGAFSLSSQAISLKLFPFLKVIHTYTQQEGQIYVPFINWTLYIGCILLVIIFKSSNNLAAAYGLAVSGVMLVTSLSMIQIAKQYWKWNSFLVYGVFIPFVIIDISFLTANSLKIVEGGYIPLGIGLLLFFVMSTWKWAKTQTAKALSSHPSMTVRQLIEHKENNAVNIPKTAIILSPDPIMNESDQIPTLTHLLTERYGLLPSTIIFLTVEQQTIPYCNNDRFVVKKFYKGKHGEITSIILHFGFRENPNVKAVLQTLVIYKDIDIPENPDEWYIHTVLIRTTSEKLHSLWGKLRYQIFKLIARNTDTAEIYFGLGAMKNISTEVFHVALR